MMLLVSLAVSATPPPLTLEVRGLKTQTGSVICTLYADADSWLSDPGYLATTSARPMGTSAVCTFPDVPPGTYAISFIHDENGNGDMDTNFFGLPREPWGMSRDAPVRLGPPSFASAAFDHPAPAALIAHLR